MKSMKLRRTGVEPVLQITCHTEQLVCEGVNTEEQNQRGIPRRKRTENRGVMTESR